MNAKIRLSIGGKSDHKIYVRSSAEF